MAEQQANIFRVRLNCVDHYQNSPSRLDPPLWGRLSLSATQRAGLPQVPVIRVFGATERGQKVCMHIHGALPYLFIPYSESLAKDVLDAYIAALRQSIDHALALSYRRNPYDTKTPPYVAHICLVKGVPFFGYNVGYRYYLKVYLLNPLHMTRFADLLQQGAILRRPFQPYEAHLQYLLQWMCDFNLYGCAFIETARPRFRQPIPSFDDLDDVEKQWHDRSIAKDHLLPEDHFPRQSHCELELDIRVEDILNRNSIQARELHHSFVERLSSVENLPPEEKLVHSMAGLWRDETLRRKRRMGLTDPSSSPFPPEVLVSMSADPRNTDKGGWIHEEEFREVVQQLADQERKVRGGADVTFETFSSNQMDDNGIQTVSQSVPELFHSKLAHHPSTQDAKVLNGDHSDHDFPLADALAVDDVKIELEHNQEGGGLPLADDEDDYGSDEEIAKIKAFTQRRKSRMGGAVVGVNGTDGHVDEAEQPRTATIPAATLDGIKNRSVKHSSGSSSDGPLKRVNFDAADQTQTKRGRFIVRDAAPSRSSESSQVTHGHPDPSHGAQQTSKPKSTHLLPEQHPPPSSQKSVTSQQSSQGSKLAFPVVKNVNDPQILQRLSQREDLAHLPHRSSQNTTKNGSTDLSDSFGKLSSSSSGSDPKVRKWPAVHSQLAKNYTAAYRQDEMMKSIIFDGRPPSCAEVEATLEPSVIYQDAYYSNEKDVPDRPREYAGQEFRLESGTLPFLPAFDRSGASAQSRGTIVDKGKEELQEQRRRRQCTLLRWEIMQPPPSSQEVQRWLHDKQPEVEDDLDQLEVDGPPTTQRLARDTWAKPAALPSISQIDGPTQKGKHGFKYSQHKAGTSVQHETGYMSTMSLEVHVNSRGELAPDPEKDEVNMVAWCLSGEKMEEIVKMGLVVLVKEGSEEHAESIRRIVGSEVEVDAEETELDIINRMVDIVRSFDPDILTGFEVHNGSWGYLIERARLQYEFNLPDEFSRMKSQSHGRFGKDADRWGFTQTSTVRITGRHTINIWRAMRSELNLLQYTMENIVFHLLHRRIPHYSFATLTRWYTSGKPRDLVRILDYLTTRTHLDLLILDANELIPRTSEQARLLGVDFFSVFSRGSQFKVESLMFRIAKPESFLLVSPSRKQVGSQNALECLPLVMEPHSAFYTSPLLVLDFQSLYPSVMIAYNYCYSTCLGRIVNWRGTNKLGFADFQRTPGLLELVKDKLNIAPNGMMYVKPEMRKSLLAKMLGEILETRVMVKSGMKVDRNDKTLQQLLNNRQLALKLIANVTYGYTSASFSGRMPCSEIADSIVQTGRETLEKAIALIHSVERWGAEVVYGDTDSLFVYLKGKSRADAFKIGDEISKTVTDMNPRPVKLKFEKVYHPCVLLAKKRYVGFKYESPTQVEPEFDAKGIETVRRDGTPAEQKMEEKALKLLFRTSDLSQVKRYFQQQCTKIMTGRFSIQDFCFAKEVKLGTYSDKGVAPPGALIATKRMLRDPRTEPQYGERVPYVVIAGAPGARLWERCVEPERLLYDEHAELDAEYYISKNLIPPLERIFNLVGANVRQWYDEMPKVQRIRMLGGPREGGGGGGGGDATTTGANAAVAKKATMESYMGSSLCLVCRTKLPPVTAATAATALPLCETCRSRNPPRTLLALRQRLQQAEAAVADLTAVCRSCAGLVWGEEVRCDSRDCPVFYSRVKADTKARTARLGVGSVVERLEGEEGLRREWEW